jgi:hypothetical protein
MISEGSSDGVIVESDGSVRGADLIISTGSPRVNQDFVSWQVETDLGFRWDEDWMIPLASFKDSRESLHGLLGHPLPCHLGFKPTQPETLVTWSNFISVPQSGGPHCSFHSTQEAQPSTTCVTT